MNYAEIKNVDISNGPGVRVSLFVSGCPHHCPGCFNPETWDFGFGAPFTSDETRMLMSMLDQPYIHGLSLLGGEPLAPENQIAVLGIVLEAKEIRVPQKDIWCYTGYQFEDLLTGRVGKYAPKILQYLDVLVDGRFEEDKKDIRLRFRGSGNQRIIDVPRSIAAGKAIWAEGYKSEETKELPDGGSSFLLSDGCGRGREVIYLQLRIYL